MWSPDTAPDVSVPWLGRSPGRCWSGLIGAAKSGSESVVNWAPVGDVDILTEATVVGRWGKLDSDGSKGAEKSGWGSRVKAGAWTVDGLVVVTGLSPGKPESGAPNGTEKSGSKSGIKTGLLVPPLGIKVAEVTGLEVGLLFGRCASDGTKGTEKSGSRSGAIVGLWILPTGIEPWGLETGLLDGNSAPEGLKDKEKSGSRSGTKVGLVPVAGLDVVTWGRPSCGATGREKSGWGSCVKSPGDVLGLGRLLGFGLFCGNPCSNELNGMVKSGSRSGVNVGLWGLAVGDVTGLPDVIGLSGVSNWPTGIEKSGSGSGIRTGLLLGILVGEATGLEVVGLLWGNAGSGDPKGTEKSGSRSGLKGLEGLGRDCCPGCWWTGLNWSFPFCPKETDWSGSTSRLISGFWCRDRSEPLSSALEGGAKSGTNWLFPVWETGLGDVACSPVGPEKSGSKSGLNGCWKMADGLCWKNSVPGGLKGTAKSGSGSGLNWLCLVPSLSCCPIGAVWRKQ